MNVEIRAATDDEWELCRDVRLRALAEAPDAFCSTLQGERDDGADVWLARLARTKIALAWRDDHVVGTAGLKPDPHENDGREIVSMWVDPTQRGQSVGESLIGALVAWARDDGATSVALWVTDHNGRARALYERCGFSATGERDLMPQGTEEIRMRRLLQRPGG